MKYRKMSLLLIVFCVICVACSSDMPLRYELEEKVQTSVIRRILQKSVGQNSPLIPSPTCQCLMNNQVTNSVT